MKKEREGRIRERQREGERNEGMEERAERGRSGGREGRREGWGKDRGDWFRSSDLTCPFLN